MHSPINKWFGAGASPAKSSGGGIHSFRFQQFYQLPFPQSLSGYAQIQVSRLQSGLLLVVSLGGKLTASQKTAHMRCQVRKLS